MKQRNSTKFNHNDWIVTLRWNRIATSTRDSSVGLNEESMETDTRDAHALTPLFMP